MFCDDAGVFGKQAEGHGREGHNERPEGQAGGTGPGHCRYQVGHSEEQRHRAPVFVHRRGRTGRTRVGPQVRKYPFLGVISVFVLM